nr:vegetative cell wall protein gp1-like [Aegilops tauschii subsp. strangulata]
MELEWRRSSGWWRMAEQRLEEVADAGLGRKGGCSFGRQSELKQGRQEAGGAVLGAAESDEDEVWSRAPGYTAAVGRSDPSLFHPAPPDTSGPAGRKPPTPSPNQSTPRGGPVHHAAAGPRARVWPAEPARLRLLLSSAPAPAPSSQPLRRSPPFPPASAGRRNSGDLAAVRASASTPEPAPRRHLCPPTSRPAPLLPDPRHLAPLLRHRPPPLLRRGAPATVRPEP